MTQTTTAAAEELMKVFWEDFKTGPRYKNGKAIGTSFSHTKAVDRIAAALHDAYDEGYRDAKDGTNE